MNRTGEWTDWFRSSDWSPEAQADFELRLKRARGHNKTQYARIKGLALRESGQVEAARQLWERVLADESDHNFDRAPTLEHLGDSFISDDPTKAEYYYRRLLQEHPTLNGTTHIVEISLAELEMAKGRRADTDDALDLLNSFLARGISQFPNVLFRWHLVLVDIASRTGDRETVQRAARTALDLSERGPVFSRHKEVGIVHADAESLRRLRRLAK